MMFVGACVSVLLLTASLMMLIVFLGSLGFLSGFKKAKIADATIVRFEFDYEDEYPGPQNVQPIVRYYNEFSKKDCEMQLKDYLNYDFVEGGKLNIGDEMRIQYTRSKARSYDERFVKNLKSRYSTLMYTMIIALCIASGVVVGIFSF